MGIDLLIRNLTAFQTSTASVTEELTHLPSLLLGVFYGIMLIMAIYNFILYLSLKDEAYLWYVGTTVFAILTTISINKLGDQFLWPNHKGLDATIYITFAGICMFFSSRFAAVFLKLKEYDKRLDHLMWIISGLSLLLSILSLVLTLEQITPFGRWLVLFTFPTYIVVAILILRKGFVPAKFYLIAWVPYALGLIVRTVHGAGWINTNQLVESSLELGGAMEIALLSFALAHRIKEIQEENIQIREQLQNYISQKIQLKRSNKNNEEISEENIKEIENKVAALAVEFDLTEREVDVLMYLAKGFSNSKIAEELFVSINTVKYHTKNIYIKLGVKKRYEINSRLLFDK